MAERKQIPARYSIGDEVQIVDTSKPGHVRTPDYVLGKRGTVKEFCGFFLNPEDLAEGLTHGPVYPLYRVEFTLKELWGSQAENPEDSLRIEIYDHWIT